MIDHARAMTRRDPYRGATEIIVFGRYPIQEALRSEGAEVLDVKVVKNVSASERQSLRSAVEAAGAVLEEVSRDEMTRYTGAQRHDQGIAARVRMLRVCEVESIIDGAKGRAARKPLRLVALDGVTNSQNVGMVVRSIVGAGLDGLLWPVVGQPWVNGLVVRAAAGAIFECPIVRCDSLVGGLGLLQAAGFSAFGLDAGAKRSLFEVDPGHRAAFVLGSESQGLSEEIRGMLDEPVSIPMAGPLESLNVAVAAGLVCFHAAGLLGPRP
jgi:23S rRNA (guanosine2251-2'-O)-methyltransferase